MGEKLEGCAGLKVRRGRPKAGLSPGRRLTQDDCPSISVARMRALGEVTEAMAWVRVTIAGMSREVGLWHMRFPNGGGWSLFLCPSCGRRARVLRLYEKMACWRCTRFGNPEQRVFYRVEQGDKAQRIERLRQRLGGGPARVKPRPGRTIDRRWRTEQALRRALIAERSGVMEAKDALAKRPDDSG
jgi:hypothetical protein